MVYPNVEVDQQRWLAAQAQVPIAHPCSRRACARVEPNWSQELNLSLFYTT